MTTTDTEAMELWRKALSAWLKPFPHLSSNQAAAAIISASLQGYKARIEALEGELIYIAETSEDDHVARKARKALEADHGA